MLRTYTDTEHSRNDTPEVGIVVAGLLTIAFTLWTINFTMLAFWLAGR